MNKPIILPLLNAILFVLCIQYLQSIIWMLSSYKGIFHLQHEGFQLLSSLPLQTPCIALLVSNTKGKGVDNGSL